MQPLTHWRQPDAKERGLQGFTADVLATNKSMMKVFERGSVPVKAELSQGVYELTIAFDAPISPSGRNISYG